MQARYCIARRLNLLYLHSSCQVLNAMNGCFFSIPLYMRIWSVQLVNKLTDKSAFGSFLLDSYIISHFKFEQIVVKKVHLGESFFSSCIFTIKLRIQFVVVNSTQYTISGLIITCQRNIHWARGHNWRAPLSAWTGEWRGFSSKWPEVEKEIISKVFFGTARVSNKSMK